MTTNRIQRLQTFLSDSAADVLDVERELQLLSQLRIRQSKRSILIIGRQNGDPLSLLSGLGLGQILPEQTSLPCPVECVYGEELSLTIRRTDNTNDRFYSGADLVRHLGTQASEPIASVLITLPSEQLRDRELLLLTADTTDMQEIQRLAYRCQGFILSLAADAGAPGEKLTELSQWLAGRGSACVVLNHAEKTLFPNKSLGSMMQLLLGGTVNVYTCRHGRPGSTGPEVILPTMLEELNAVETPDADEDIGRVVNGIRERLLTLSGELDAKQLRYREEEKSWLEAIDTLNNEALVNRYNLSGMITEAEQHSLHLEILRFTRYLESLLPTMANELMQNSENAKEDMLNLCCEYIEKTLESFLMALMKELITDTMEPRARTVFAATQNNVRMLVEKLPMEEMDETAKKDARIRFLRTLHLNIGQVESQLAIWLRRISSMGASLLLSRYIENPFIRHRYTKMIGHLVSDAVNALIPTSVYINEIIAKLNKELPADTQAETLYQALRDSLIPLAIRELENSYDSMVSDYEAPFRSRADQAHRMAEACGEKKAAADRLYTELTAL